MARIVNFGSFCLDTVLSVPRIVAPGETLATLRPARVLPGGKGSNQSLAAARAGADVLHLGRVGEDGAPLLALLEEAGVDVSGVRVDRSVGTGQAIVQVADDGENAIVIVAGANRDLPADFLAPLPGLLGEGDWLLLQNETDLVPEAIAIGGASPARVALNLAPADAAARAWPLEHVDLFLLNETEAALLTGQAQEAEQLRWLAARAPGAQVVLTLGEGGAVLFDGRERHAVAAHGVDVVDSTGAGDAFTGALLAAFCAGCAPAVALARANAAGALACTRPGAAGAMPTAAEIDGLLSAR